MKANDVIAGQLKTSIRSAGNKRLKFSYNQLYKWLAILLPFVFALFLGLLMAEKTILGLGFIGLLVGFAVLLICVLNAEAGLYIILAYSFLISFFNRLFFEDAITVGVFADILIGTTFFGFVIRKKNLKKEGKEFIATKVGAILLIVYLYTLFEIFNPAGPSIKAAIPVIRKIASVFLILFIAFSLFKSEKKIQRFINVLFFFCVLSAVYACVQEWHGFFEFEMDWLRADPRRFRMTFINGGARRMSFFIDAVALSIIMSVGSVFFTGIAVRETNMRKRLLIIAGVVLMIIAMGYSLIRTSNVMIVAGISMLMFITMDKKLTRILAGIGLAGFLFILYGPFWFNNQIAQFRQTFKGGTKDPSYLVREMNRKSIQPYMYSHPFGGGLSTTGEEGLMYHPGHRLAGFPPDSGYLKKALELGWIGFALILFLYFRVLKKGVEGYFSNTSAKNKMLFAACTAALFTFYVGDFSQVAMGQITDVVVYYPLIAIILRLPTGNLPSQNQSITV